MIWVWYGAIIGAAWGLWAHDDIVRMVDQFRAWWHRRAD